MLEGFLSPRSVAVIGAAREEGKVGHVTFDNLVASRFSGPIYAVNPKCDEIHGMPCYPSVLALPGPVDLAVIVVPAARVATVLEECGQAGVRSAIVISAGFKETGVAGAALEREVLATAQRHGIRVLGPNCLGLISSPSSLNASFAATMPTLGRIAFMSQSGALGTAILDWAAGESIGLSYFASLGNKADLSEVDFVRAWKDDPHAGVVVAYLESVTDGAGFVEAASALVRDKPFLVVKAGGSDAGARAVSSHTGSLAGAEAAYDAAFRKAGVTRARTVEELFDFAVAFSRQPLPEGAGLAILTNAGGPAIMATDACERVGVSMASLESETIAALQTALPAAAALYNPVDVLGDAEPARYAAALTALYADQNVNAVLVILTPQAMTDIAQTARTIGELARESGTTTLASFMGEATVREGWDVLREADVPNYPFPERAVAAIGAMERYRTFLSAPVPVETPIGRDPEPLRAAIERARETRRTFITDSDAAVAAAAYGIRVPTGGFAHNLAAAKKLAAGIGYPVALKASSPDILHKSDIGSIRLGIADEDALVEAYEDVIGGVRRRMPEARLFGVTVQQMAGSGREIIIGVNRDPQFGPLVMFGLGGIYVEALKDVTFRLAPVTLSEARTMVTEIRSYPLLRGVRGEPPADVESIADTIVRVSALALDFPEIVELDINPLIVHDRGDGAVAVDIRIGIGG